MKLLFIIDNSKKKELENILKADPYAEISFSKIGYTVRDGMHFDKNGKQILMIDVFDDEKRKFVMDKLKEIAEEITGEDKEKILKKIEEEESAAQTGFGSLFGQ